MMIIIIYDDNMIYDDKFYEARINIEITWLID